MAKSASEYHRGDMDIHQQEATYELVMNLTKWGSLAVAVSVLFLTLWFCTKAGFLGALAASVVVTVAGAFFLRGRSEGH